MNLRRVLSVLAGASVLAIAGCGDSEKTSSDKKPASSAKPASDKKKLSQQDKEPLRKYLTAFRRFNRAPTQVVKAMQTTNRPLFDRTKAKALLDMDRYQKEMLLAATEVKEPKVRSNLQQTAMLARKSTNAMKDLIDAVDSQDEAGIKKAQAALRRVTTQRQKLGVELTNLMETEYEPG